MQRRVFGGIKQTCVAGVAVGVLSVVIGAMTPHLTAAESRSTVRQEILLPNCTAPGGCQLAQPEVYATGTVSHWPVLQGSYDATYTQILRILFHGNTYVLGAASELSVRGGEWTLDLRHIDSPLAAGEYTIVVESVGYDGTLVRDRSSVTVSPQSSEGADEAGARVGANDASEGISASPDDAPAGTNEPTEGSGGANTPRSSEVVGESGQLASGGDTLSNATWLWVLWAYAAALLVCVGMYFRKTLGLWLTSVAHRLTKHK